MGRRLNREETRLTVFFARPVAWYRVNMPIANDSGRGGCYEIPPLSRRPSSLRYFVCVWVSWCGHRNLNC
jgi:hypothetical protein